MGGNPCNRPAHRLEERPGIGFQSTFVGQVFPAVTNDFLFHSRLWVTRVPPLGRPLGPLDWEPWCLTWQWGLKDLGVIRPRTFRSHCQVSTQRLRMGWRKPSGWSLQHLVHKFVTERERGRGLCPWTLVLWDFILGSGQQSCW